MRFTYDPRQSWKISQLRLQSSTEHTHHEWLLLIRQMILPCNCSLKSLLHLCDTWNVGVEPRHSTLWTNPEVGVWETSLFQIDRNAYKSWTLAQELHFNSNFLTLIRESSIVVSKAFSISLPFKRSKATMSSSNYKRLRLLTPWFRSEGAKRPAPFIQSNRELRLSIQDW